MVLWTIPGSLIAATLGLLFISLGITSTVDSWNATHGAVLGTLTPEEIDCKSRNAYVVGRFESADGATNLDGILYNEDLGGCPEGDVPGPERVAYPGYGTEVFASTDSTWTWAWLMCVVGVLVATVLIGLVRGAGAYMSGHRKPERQRVPTTEKRGVPAMPLDELLGPKRVTDGQE